MSCAAWQLRLWTVDKMTGARESVDLMCGQDARREYTVPRCSAVQCSTVQCSTAQYSTTFQGFCSDDLVLKTSTVGFPSNHQVDI